MFEIDVKMQMRGLLFNQRIENAVVVVVVAFLVIGLCDESMNWSGGKC
jgi:hypothetical protein